MLKLLAPRAARVAPVLSVVVCFLLASPPAAASLHFSEISASALKDGQGQPMTLTHDSRGFLLPCSPDPCDPQEWPDAFGPGVAWADVNDDGWPDMIVVNGSIKNRAGTPAHNYLMLNNGDGTFTDVSQAWGVATSRVADGLALADVNNDGTLDLAIANFFAEPQFFVGGGNVLSEQSVHFGLDPLLPAGQPIQPESMGVAFGDYDQDGYVDLYVANYLDQPDQLFHNLSGDFFERTGDLPVGHQEFGFQPVFLDFDNDGDLDIYVTNDFGPNYLFENQGRAAGFTFVEVARTYKVAGGASSADPYSMDMGVAVGDYNNDGYLDIYTTIYNGNAFYENQGPQVGGGWRFTNRAVEKGVKWGLNCWGADFCDLDNDGDLDLIFASGFVNGYTNNQPTGIPNKVYLNSGAPDWTFTDVSLAAAFADTNMGRGLATADFDRDGDLDVAVTNNSFFDPLVAPWAALYEGHCQLYRNDQDSGNHWAEFKLIGGGEHQPGLGCNRCAIGARVYLTAGGTTQMREIEAGSSYLSQNSLDVEFGLGQVTAITEVRVRWPCGAEEVFSGVSADHFYRLIEGRGSALPLPVALESFTAQPQSDGIRLEWRVSGDLAASAVRVQRAVVQAVGDVARLVPLALPIDDRGGSGSALDRAVQPGRTYAYQLLVPVQGGDALASATVYAVAGGGPAPRQRPALGQNFPNPFNPSTTILFDLPHPARVRLSLYDPQGRLVRVLVDGELPAGEHQAHWDGRDQNGLAVGSGAYFYALVTPDGTSSRRLVLTR